MSFKGPSKITNTLSQTHSLKHVNSGKYYFYHNFIINVIDTNAGNCKAEATLDWESERDTLGITIL